MGRRPKKSRPVEFAGFPIYQSKYAWNWHCKDPESGMSKTIRLALISATPSEVLAEFEAKQKELQLASMQSTGNTKGSVAYLIDQFFESLTFTDLASGTQEQYKKNARQVLKVFRLSSNGKQIMADNVRPQHVRKYLDLRGKVAKTSANRELAFLSRVYGWAYERGIVASNPCKGVRRFTETARERYITDAEYYAVLAQSDDRLRAIIEIAYCCAARVSDVLKIERRDIREDGIFISQGKTGKAQIKGWTPRLRAAIEIARRVSVQHTKWMLTNSHGNRIVYGTFRKWWTTARDQAAKVNPELQFDFTFHDIKAKSISDWEGDKQKFSGHKTQSQVAIYDRKVPVVGTHE